MKKNLSKKLFLRKLTLTNLDPEKLKKVRGGKLSPTIPPYCFGTYEPGCDSTPCETGPAYPSCAC